MLKAFNAFTSFFNLDYPSFQTFTMATCIHHPSPVRSDASSHMTKGSVEGRGGCKGKMGQVV